MFGKYKDATDNLFDRVGNLEMGLLSTNIVIRDDMGKPLTPHEKNDLANNLNVNFQEICCDDCKKELGKMQDTLN